MAELYYYAYAEIDPDTGMCVGVCTQTYEDSSPYLIRIPEYNEEYAFKYYNMSDGQWYEDAGFTIPWTPPVAE